MQGLDLPELPGSHAQYLLHDHDCSFWGLYGYALRRAAGTLQSASARDVLAALPFSHFFFTGSMVRGPFIPPPLRVSGQQPLACKACAGQLTSSL